MKSTVNKVAECVMEYFMKEDPTQIPHTQCVASYTHYIAVCENLPEHETGLIEMAAWMHDIGCPESKKKYGNTLPVHQEEEGRIVAGELLKNIDGLTENEKAWIADVVGNHHKRAEVDRLKFAPLFDADCIVNMTEGYYPKENAGTFLEKAMSTKCGKEIFRKLFLEAKQ